MWEHAKSQNSCTEVMQRGASVSAGNCFRCRCTFALEGASEIAYRSILRTVDGATIVRSLIAPDISSLGQWRFHSPNRYIFSQRGLMRIGIATFTLVGMVLVGTTASAQERRVGLSMGYPANVGVLWTINDRIGVRPGVSFGHNSFDPGSLTLSLGTGSSVTTESTSESTFMGVRLDTLLSVGVWDNVRAYVVPGYEYQWSRFTRVESTINTGPFAAPKRTETRETHGHEHHVSGLFGARYVPHPRFGIFGEVGLTWSDSRTDLFDTVSKGHGWNTTTGAGAIFYF
jgi:hypothetical protein